MTDHSLSQVEDAFKAQIDAWPALSAWTVKVAESVDVSIEDAELPCFIITTMDWQVDVADENWMAFHQGIISVEAVSDTAATGIISRVNRDALGEVIKAIAADRSLGLGLQDVQETSMAPTEPEGKDLGSASLLFNVSWFTPRGDHFTIS